MIPVAMERAGGAGTKDGDCLMACVASILELELATLPVITGERDDQWFTILSDSVRARGFRVVEFSNDPPVNPPGYAIGLGATARTNEIHAVVCLDGNIVHDPHPTRDGITHLTYWLMLVPFARMPQLVAPTQSAAEFSL